jgi:PIN domain nuclease of toxin-antitoxin system
MTASGPGPLVIDTHTAVWFLQRDERLSRRARADINNALAARHPIHMPSIQAQHTYIAIRINKYPSIWQNSPFPYVHVLA